MKIFLELTDLLNHLDISGMNFDDKSLIKLCEVMSCCPNLMVIHLSDNHLLEHRNESLLKEVLSIFDLSDHDITEINRSKKETKEINNDKQIKEMLMHEINQKQHFHTEVAKQANMLD